MTIRAFVVILCALPAEVISTNNETVIEDPLAQDPNLEIVHLYKNQWPVGIAVSNTGRKFSCFPSGLDGDNTYTGNNGVFQVGELTSFDEETAWPDVETNSPPGGCLNFSGPFPVSVGDPDHFLSVQTVVCDKDDKLYVLDTGRCMYQNVVTDSTPGGPKIVIYDLNDNDALVQTITFDPRVLSAIGYPLDICIDEGRQIAYVSDGSPSGPNALLIIFLLTGEQYRRLDYDPSVTAVNGFLGWVWGSPVYQQRYSGSGIPIDAIFPTFGVDGVTVSSDKSTLYWSPFASRFLYCIDTETLLNLNASEADVSSAVRNKGEVGFAGGIASATDETVFAGQAENDGVTMYKRDTGFATLLVHDPRINFVDRFALLNDTIYFVVNQLMYTPLTYPGTDRRVKPYVLFAYPLDNGTNIGVGN